MKKTLTVNLGGTVFHIDEDAYQLLDKYLSNLRIHFREEEGSDEIMDDFEARISELLGERVRLGYEVITIEQVEEIIKRMGKPEEIFEGEGEAPRPEESGEAYGFNLIYSGNYENSVEVDALGNTRVLSGISNYAFDWELGAGERFFTPEAIMVYTECGLGGMSRLMHDFVREQIIPPAFAHRHRPVVLNTWEGCYFDVDELKLLSLAEVACRIGTEVLVLDDGWFRSNDEENLGDWGVDYNRFPHGLAWLSDRLHEKGLGFGLWFEPEMVNPKSRLYKEHPDWIVGSGSTRYFSRNQLVLDMGNPAVVRALASYFGEVFRNFDRNMCRRGRTVRPWDALLFASDLGERRDRSFSSHIDSTRHKPCLSQFRNQQPCYGQCGIGVERGYAVSVCNGIVRCVRL